MFPVLFVAGPEGFHVISWSGSIIGHTVADILSKNLWGLIGHYLRYKVSPKTPKLYNENSNTQTHIPVAHNYP